MQTITSERFLQILERGEWKELLNGDENIQVDSGNNRTTIIRIEDIIPKDLLFHNYKRQREKGLFKQLKQEYEKINGDEDKVTLFLRRYTKLKFKKYVPNEDHILFMIEISKEYPEIWQQVVEEDAEDNPLVVNVQELNND
jgi:hypothetical protein